MAKAKEMWTMPSYLKRRLSWYSNHTIKNYGYCKNPFLGAIIVCIIAMSDSQVSLNNVFLHSPTAGFACSFSHHSAFVETSIPLYVNMV